jgi:inner membrane protein
MIADSSRHVDPDRRRCVVRGDTAPEMDSLTHIALGAAIGTAVLGRKAGVRAAAWGAVCATLPDVDVLIAHGDPVLDFTLHRGDSHSLFWLTAFAPVVAWLVARLNRSVRARYGEWLALAWLALVTHPLLDAFTVYGTQLLRPFSDHPFGTGSIFIIDPLYTMPLVIGTVAALRLVRREPDRARRWIAAGLALATLYLGWTLAAQEYAAGRVRGALAQTPLAAAPTLVTSTPFNSLLWRIVVMEHGGYREGYYSLLDGDRAPVLIRHQSRPDLLASLGEDPNVRRLAWFSKGFYAVREAGPDTRVADGSAGTLGQLLGFVETAAAHDALADQAGSPVVMTDLRMGQTPWFAFSFVVGASDGRTARAVPARQVPTERPPVAVLGWLWQRIWSPDTAPAPLI